MSNIPFPSQLLTGATIEEMGHHPSTKRGATPGAGPSRDADGADPQGGSGPGFASVFDEFARAGESGAQREERQLNASARVVPEVGRESQVEVEQGKPSPTHPTDAPVPEQGEEPRDPTQVTPSARGSDDDTPDRNTVSDEVAPTGNRIKQPRGVAPDALAALAYPGVFLTSQDVARVASATDAGHAGGQVRGAATGQTGPVANTLTTTPELAPLRLTEASGASNPVVHTTHSIAPVVSTGTQDSVTQGMGQRRMTVAGSVLTGLDGQMGNNGNPSGIASRPDGALQHLGIAVPPGLRDGGASGLDDLGARTSTLAKTAPLSGQNPGTVGPRAGHSVADSVKPMEVQVSVMPQTRPGPVPPQGGPRIVAAQPMIPQTPPGDGSRVNNPLVSPHMTEPEQQVRTVLNTATAIPATATLSGGGLPAAVSTGAVEATQILPATQPSQGRDAFPETAPSQSRVLQPGVRGLETSMPASDVARVAPAAWQGSQPEPVAQSALTRQSRDAGPRGDVGASSRAEVSLQTTLQTTPLNTPMAVPVTSTSALTATANLGTDTGMSIEGDTSSFADEFLTDPLLDPRSASLTTTATSRTAPVGFSSAAIAAQIADALGQTRTGQVELRLNPEELGQVRISLSPSEGAITMSIQAERAETLDLMRRHIAELTMEFEALGYDTITFEFGHSGLSGQNGQASDADTQRGGGTVASEMDDTAMAVPLPLAQTAQGGATTGLDLRL
ncbi:MAG: hypothetical protein CSA70_09720 [Rhodobacterales bacterium]|nr:MAG: hypothetical protein CSA70_09720 [Rhodobacterales bacterium]